MSILLGLIGPAKKQAFDKLKLGESFPLPEGLWFKWCFRNKDNIKTLLNKLASENLDDTIEQTALDLVSDLFKHDLEGINSKLQKELDANRPTTDRPRIESLLNKIKGFLDKLSEKTAPQTDLLLDSNFDHLRLMLDQIGNQLENNFDANQTSVFIKAQLGALLSNPAFLNLVKELLEPFSQPELTILLAAMDKGGEFEATQLMALKRYLLGQPLENGDQLILDALFMPQPPHTALDWDHFPIKKHLDLLQELMQELLACQCFFHHHDFTGQQTDDGPVPKLHNQISPSLKWIRVDNNDHTATTRKLSYLHAVNEGLQASDKIREAREKPAQDWLKRIHNHILRPILWPRAYPIWNKLVNGWFNFVNVCKSVFNACLGSNHLQISEKNKESNRCESEANAFNNQFAKLLARGGSAEQKLFALECRNAGGEDSSEQKQDRVLPHPLSQPVGLNNQTLIAQGAKSLNSSGTPSS